MRLTATDPPPSSRACARGWCATKVNSRQGKSVSNKAGTEVFVNAWTYSAAVISCAWKISQAVEVTQSVHPYHQLWFMR